MTFETPHGWSGDVAPDVALTRDMDAEVPSFVDVLPDGTEVVVFGDVPGLSDLVHEQGQNDAGFEGTCGLCSCEDVLRQFGVDVTEDDIVKHAILNGQCEISDDPEMAGGTTPFNQVDILRDHGVPAHVELGESLEDLASSIEQGRGVIVGVNAGLLWNTNLALDMGGPNHAVVPIGVARDPDSGEIKGFYLNDSAPGGTYFVDAKTMEYAWMFPNGGYGRSVVTDVVRA